MKKLTSILCALVIALGAIAAPQLRAEKVASLSKAEKIEKKAAEQAFVGIKTVKEAKAEKIAFKHIRKAKAGEPTNVTINAIQTEFDEDYNEFSYILVDANGYYYIFGFASTGEDPVVAGTTYTLEDMEEAYLYRSYGDWPDFTACTFKKTIVDGKVKIEATATDEEGGEWILSYDESAIPELPEGGTFVADQIVADLYSSDIWYKLTATDARLTFYFDILLSGGAKDVESGKTYALADMDDDYTYIVFNQTTKIAVTSVSFTKIVAEDGSYTIAAVIVDENSNTWNIAGAKAAPTIENKSLTLEGITNIGTSYSQIEAADEDTTKLVSLIIDATRLVGSFTEDDIYTSYSFVMLVDVQGEERDTTFYMVSEAAFSIAYVAEAGKYNLTGTLKTANEDDELDQIIFTLNLTLDGEAPVEPTVTDVTVSYYTKEFYEEDNDVFYILYNEDESNAFRFDIVLPAGSKDVENDHTYTLADMLANYSWLGPDKYSAVSYETVSFIKHVSAKGAVSITATIVDKDENTWNLSYTEPEPEEINEEQVTINVLTLNEGDGYWQLMGYSADKSYYVSLAAITNTIAGEYTIDDLATSYCYIVKNASSADYAFYDAREAALTVTYEDGVVRATGTILTANRNDLTKQIKFTVDFSNPKPEPTAVEAVKAENKAVKRIVNGQVVIEKNGVRYNLLGTEIK